MTGKGLKANIFMTFAMMLVMAMCLQSIVFLFLGVRAAVKEEVAWGKRTLQSFAMFAEYTTDGREEKQLLMTTYDRLQEEHSQTFSCLNIELEELTVGLTPCLFPDELFEKSKEAKKTTKPVVGFAGSDWNVFLVRSDVAQLAVPLKNKAGQTIGTISAELSLLPIYSRFEQEAWVALFYLLVNATIFLGLGFFRMQHILFRPLERLVQKAENYSPDQQTLFLVSDDESAFRKLSVSLNTLLDRIERDNRMLRHTVSELEMVNRELTEKNDLVIRSEKLASVGRLSAGLAHEIGNPLSIIQGYVELLRREDLTSDEKQQFSGKAQQELDRIKRLIRQLLDFAGTIHSAENQFAVNALIDDVIGLMLLEKSFSDCSIVTELLAEHDEIVADKDALKQVLINCLLNAADATADVLEEVREIVVASCNEENGNMGRVLVISIRDNGTGIDQENLKNIFDPFFTTKEIGRGTGLGLFVCHTIIERMGGTITIANRTSSGIEVRLIIPISQIGLS
ncbi:MAG: hypothetical protein KJ630_00340 [Proteobacteria bacterium]|nr:hypothetical protein [Pseudomonadota bacterium]